MLEKYFRKWNAAFPTHEVTKLQMAVYLEALDDLSLDALEYGCREATRTAEQFPKPGHIHKAAEGYVNDRSMFLGPPRPAYLNEPTPIRTKEEQEECDRYSAQLKKTLLAVSEPFRDKDGNHTAACLCIRCRIRRADEQRNQVQDAD